MTTQIDTFSPSAYSFIITRFFIPDSILRASLWLVAFHDNSKLRCPSLTWLLQIAFIIQFNSFVLRLIPQFYFFSLFTSRFAPWQLSRHQVSITRKMVCPYRIRPVAGSIGSTILNCCRLLNIICFTTNRTNSLNQFVSLAS